MSNLPDGAVPLGGEYPTPEAAQTAATKLSEMLKAKGKNKLWSVSKPVGEWIEDPSAAGLSLHDKIYVWNLYLLPVPLNHAPIPNHPQKQGKMRTLFRSEALPVSAV